jgi:exodeoxyribonuclease V gamma subunit
VFIVHHGNRLEHLAGRLVEHVRAPLPTPFTPETVVVQSLGMARWLSLWLATELGVCTNVQFPFPATFVWEVFRTVIGPLPVAPAFDPAVMVWHLLALLRQLDASPANEPLRAYLNDDDDRRRFELARKIADTFDQYLVYRPDWILAWERGEEDDWQARLWRQLVARVGGAHRVQLWQAFRTHGLSAAHLEALPPRLTLFGIPAMPPLYLDVFARLAESIDVHCFILDPCQESWSHLLRERDQARMAGVGDPDDLHLDTGNRLLASLGRQGREFLDQLAAYGPHEETHFVSPAGDTLLATLQRDILTLTDRAGHSAAAVADDLSVQVHVCHSPVREIEVLHDQLLLLFDTHPDLQPAEVVVMTPDIDLYAPAIDAVFGTVARERHIPYTIADRRLQQESPLIEAFLELLQLPASRFEAGRLLALLAVPAVRRRFALDEAGVARIRTWVRETGIRWGLDAQTHIDAGLPATTEHTWRFGLDRLLLGYALGEVGATVSELVAPHDDVDGSDATALGQLHTFIETLAAVAAALAAPRPAPAWGETLRQVLDQCLLADETEERDLQLLRAAIARFVSTAADGAYDDPIPLDLVTAHIRESLDVPGGTARFLAGGVTFCALMPMRSIPFAVVALVGMDDGSVPRSSRPQSFDRMAGSRRRGDRSRRDDDRYLFLEALCSARQCFYLSYVGRDIRDNTPRPPSILVSELLDYVGGPLAAAIVTEHPLQAFSRRYFDGSQPRLVSHSAELCHASGTVRQALTRAQPFAPARLPPAGPEFRTVPLARLVQFFTHPSRFLLRERLGIRIDDADTRVESREPFLLDGLGRYGVRRALLGLQQRGADLPAAERALRSRGLLPHGTVGELATEAEWSGVQAFGQRLALLAAGPALPPVPLALTLDQVTIVGELSGLVAEGRIAYRLGHTRPSDRVGLWLAHLVLQLAAPAGVGGTTRWLSDDEEVVLTPVAEAAAMVRTLLQAYLDGLERPLPFFPRSAWAFVSKPKQPWGAARACWEGDEYHPGESDDPYHAIAFRARDPIDEEFGRLAADILGPWATYAQGAP